VKRCGEGTLLERGPLPTPLPPETPTLSYKLLEGVWGNLLSYVFGVFGVRKSLVSIRSSCELTPTSAAAPICSRLSARRFRTRTSPWVTLQPSGERVAESSEKTRFFAGFVKEYAHNRGA
jgi:hypothetical protein